MKMSTLHSVENVLVGTVVGVLATPTLHQSFNMVHAYVVQFTVELAAMVVWFIARSAILHRPS